VRVVRPATCEKPLYARHRRHVAPNHDCMPGAIQKARDASVAPGAADDPVTCAASASGGRHGTPNRDYGTRSGSGRAGVRAALPHETGNTTVGAVLFPGLLFWESRKHERHSSP
jgi:hypothetical protein